MVAMSDEKKPARRRNKFLVVVDDSPEVHAALRYATMRARNVGGGIVLLRVVPPPDFQHWMAVEKAMREEAREEAEKLLQQLAEVVHRDSGITPELIIREGNTRDELLALMAEDPMIRILVLAAAPGTQGPGPLVSSLAGQMSGNLSFPITVVPGSMSDAELDEVT
jgi:nucleotide-binding universal stress UspA family protein